MVLVSGTGLRNLSAALLGIVLAIPALAQILTDQIWNELASGNRRFVEGKAEPRDLVARRRELAKTQHPRVAVLSCADSRVPPELVFDAGLGDLFVVRSAGENADELAVGSLEYAVEHLGTVVIVVMGHQSCGAVKAACSGEKAGSPNLEAVVTPIASSCTKVDKSKPDTLDLAIRDHVHSVAQELLAKSVILKKAADEGKLTIIETYYSLDTGEVTKLR
jgi:carbonic anhydrase